MSIFSKVPVKKVRHNTFDLSHEVKLTGEIGKLIPCFIAEAVPNDKFNITTNQLVRFAPMLAPVMHRISVYTHFFFVPNRILWDGWEDFINGGNDGEDVPPFPVFNANSASFTKTNQSLADYLGFPVGQTVGATLNVSALPMAAYQRIWFEYYRDQNILKDDYYPQLGVSLADGDNSAYLSQFNPLRKRAWQHDYFTSALPWTQRGPEATVPITGEADINWAWVQADVPKRSSGAGVGDGNITSYAYKLHSAADNVDISIDNSANLTADLSTATAASINDLRRAFRLQEWLEINARSGARYNETIKAHFGISPGDARLQRPEFLGGTKTPVVISEVLQTSSTDATSPQGNMSGHGVSIGGKKATYYTCREHGYIIGLLSVMPKTAYQQGLAKHWYKFDKFDYFWRSFANIGEQPILNKEVFLNTADGLDDDVFGYTPRYAEYKYINDRVHGGFRTTLDFWHAGRKFTNRPTLSAAFVECNDSEVERIFAVPASPEQIYVQMYHTVKARRPMPYFGTPTL